MKKLKLSKSADELTKLEGEETTDPQSTLVNIEEIAEAPPQGRNENRTPEQDEIARLRAKLASMQLKIDESEMQCEGLKRQNFSVCYAAAFMLPFFESSVSAYNARPSDFRRLFDGNGNYDLAARIVENLLKADGERVDFIRYLISGNSAAPLDEGTYLSNFFKTVQVSSAAELQLLSNLACQTGLLGLPSAFPSTFGLDVSGDYFKERFSGVSKTYLYELCRAIQSAIVEEGEDEAVEQRAEQDSETLKRLIEGD